MKRKRFMGLLMSKGVPRNKAALVAEDVTQFGSYVDLYKHCRSALILCTVGVSYRKCTKAMRKMNRKFREAFSGYLDGSR